MAGKNKIFKKARYYFKIWVIYARNALIGWSVNRNVFIIFLIGKIVRYIAYFGFLYFLMTGAVNILGYTKNQVLLFTATFVLVDTVSQFFFRSVYTFRQLIVTGDFDLVLVKPVNALFRSLFGAPDPIDLVTIPPIIFIVVYLSYLISPSAINVFYFVLLILNALVISAAFHMIVLAFGIITTEVDHAIIVYRDISSMGRFPVDIYGKGLSLFLTFVVPIGIMVSLPAKTLIGINGGLTLLGATLFGAVFIFLAYNFWKFALRSYTSASS